MRLMNLLLTATLTAPLVSGLLAIQDAESPAWVSKVPADQGTNVSVFVPTVLPLAQGVEANALVSVSETLLDATSGAPVRVVMMDVTCGLKMVELQRNHLHATVSSASDIPMRMSLGSLDTQVAHLRAAECLGAVTDDGMVSVLPVEEAVIIEEYTLSVAPLEGLGWGEVRSALDLVISVEPSN